MRQLIDAICDNAIKQVFSEDVLSDNCFETLCYKQMIDDSHSIVIWGDSDGDRCFYVISIREGATNTDDGLMGKREIFCDATPNNTHEELYRGIEKKITDYFKIIGNQQNSSFDNNLEKTPLYQEFSSTCHQLGLFEVFKTKSQATYSFMRKMFEEKNVSFKGIGSDWYSYYEIRFSIHAKG